MSILASKAIRSLKLMRYYSGMFIQEIGGSKYSNILNNNFNRF